MNSFDLSPKSGRETIKGLQAYGGGEEQWGYVVQSCNSLKNGLERSIGENVAKRCPFSTGWEDVLNQSRGKAKK